MVITSFFISCDKDDSDTLKSEATIVSQGECGWVFVIGDEVYKPTNSFAEEFKQNNLSVDIEYKKVDKRVTCTLWSSFLSYQLEVVNINKK